MKHDLSGCRRTVNGERVQSKRGAKRKLSRQNAPTATTKKERGQKTLKEQLMNLRTITHIFIDSGYPFGQNEQTMVERVKVLKIVEGLAAELIEQRDNYAKVEGTGTYSPIMPLSDVIKLLDWVLARLGCSEKKQKQKKEIERSFTKKTVRRLNDG